MSALPLLIFRPEPGASASRARAKAAGVDAVMVPLFALESLPWAVPRPDDYHALMLTSANAVTLAGPDLAALAALPALCVGDATATAARASGLHVAQTGGSGVQALVDDHLAARILWLAGEDHTKLETVNTGMIDIIPVYRAMPLSIDPEALRGPAVALVHSTRVAQRIATLVPYHPALRIVAISPAVAAACGEGWASVSVASRPDDVEMVAIARELCQDGISEMGYR